MIMSLVVYAMLLASDFKSAGNGLKYVLQFIPHFCITFGLMRFSDQAMKNNRCNIKTITCPGLDVCCRKFVNYLIHLLMCIEMLTVMLFPSSYHHIITHNFNWHPTSFLPAGYFHRCYKVANVCTIMENCVLTLFSN